MKNSVLSGFLLSVFAILVLVSCNNNHRPKSPANVSVTDIKAVEQPKAVEPKVVEQPKTVESKVVEKPKTVEPKVVIQPKVVELQPVVNTLNIATSFIPCGWFGDGQLGAQCLQFDPNWTLRPHSNPSCIKISYNLGPQKFAGIYWLKNAANIPCNWGQARGYDLSKKGFTRITFWAKGNAGNESVQFKAGGVTGFQYVDSFDYEPKLDVTLGLEWQQYTIDLKGMNLSCVIGGFCWVSTSSVTFYLDDLRYE